MYDSGKRGREAVIGHLNALIEYWQITTEELEAPSPPPAAPPPPRGIKYRHPRTGDTWDGSGEHPPWLRRALLTEGYRVDELRPELQSAPGAGEE